MIFSLLQVTVYISSFKVQVWIAILLSIPVIAIIMSFIYTYSGSNESEKGSYISTILYAYGAFVNER